MATIRKRNGKYQVQVRREGQPGISRTFHMLKDAQQWAKQTEAKVDRDGLEMNRDKLKAVTLGDLVRRYRDEVVPTKKGAEIETIILNAFLRDPICDKRMDRLKATDFARYRDGRLETITAKSLKRQLSPIHNLFEVARDEWGLPIKENPLDKVRLKVTDNRRERRLKEGELERIVAAAKTRKNPYILPIILFAIETGMRRGEILNMCWDQIDWKRQLLTIPEAKNGYSRTIPLAPNALKLLVKARDDQKGISNAIGSSPVFLSSKVLSSTSSQVFPTTANAVRLSWERIKERARIEDLHFHDLRHEAISRFFEMGLTVPEVALISGHRDARMLLRYAHARLEQISIKIGNCNQ